MDGSVSHAPTSASSLAGSLSPDCLSGVLDLYRQAAPEEFFRQLEKELGLLSRRRIFNLPLVIWLMMVQYLDRKATLSTAVQQVARMRPRASLLPDHKRLREGTVSAHTGAYSDARQRMPPSGSLQDMRKF